MFSYNTLFHRTIKTSPFFPTYGMEPRLPALPAPDLRRQFYGESTTDDLIQKLLLTRDIARRNSEVASEEAKRQFNKKAEPHAFLPDQLVLLDKHSFLAKNQKLAPKWSGPHKILHLKGECNVELLLRHNNKKLITHVNRLKPYFVPKSTAVSSPNFFLAQKPATPPPAAQEIDNTENFLHDNGNIEKEVSDTDPYTAENILPPPSRGRRTASSSSSLYNEHARPADLSSPTPTYAQIVTHKQSVRTSSSSSSASLRPPP
jgi:hypothetical protein